MLELVCQLNRRTVRAQIGLAIRRRRTHVSVRRLRRETEMFRQCMILVLVLLAARAEIDHNCAFAGPPQELRPWLEPQEWSRDVDRPVVSLGDPGDFDDTHIFAPCVALIGDRYRLLYCGSTGRVAERVFHLGAADSNDGRHFTKIDRGKPIFSFGDLKHSVLTPTFLRNANGSLLREDGRIRMWFSSTDFTDPSGLHTLHETFSTDGLKWDQPSKSLLSHVYAPTILKEGAVYRMWYTDPSSDPWSVRYAESRDGRRWRVRPDPVLALGAKWERSRLFYPTVVRSNGIYLMWYGSYWNGRSSKTALGMAASLDGIKWYRNPHNPVFTPDASRPWESHYTTSQTVMQLSDGSWRIWYASRKAPPFVNKYFAIGTATWGGPDPSPPSLNPVLNPDQLATFDGKDRFSEWKTEQQSALRDLLGIPPENIALAPEQRGQFEHDGIVIEKWIYTSERGSKVPAVVYRPKQIDRPLPGVVLTFGHGGSKSHPSYQYIGQLYTKLGLVCLAADPIGEEERHRELKRGTRAHDPHSVHAQAWQSGRPIMGKLVYDTMRGVDLLLSRDDVDPQRIGVVGNSLGGAKAGWMAALDSRLRFAIVSGWAFDDVGLWTKYCTGAPNQLMRERLSWREYLSLAAPNCSVFVMNGTADGVIDRRNDGSAWIGTRRSVSFADQVSQALGGRGRQTVWFENGGGHRPYPAHRQAIEWLFESIAPDDWTQDLIDGLKEVNFEAWAMRHDIQFEKLYGTPLHLGGATVVERRIRPLSAAELSALKPEERGSAEFTIEGWLASIKRQAR